MNKYGHAQEKRATGWDAQRRNPVAPEAELLSGGWVKRTRLRSRGPSKKKEAEVIYYDFSLNCLRCRYLAMVVVVIPVVMMVMTRASIAISATIHIFPTIGVVIAIVVVGAGAGIYAAMMFSVSVASIDARPAVIAGTRIVRAGLGRETGGQAREQERKHKFFHFKSSTIS